MLRKKGFISIFLLLGILGLFQEELSSFCGFYVAKADAKLFNEASKVVLVRNGNKTVVGMMNDYKGELKDFAIVIPVPVVLKREQINVGNQAVFDHLDAYTAPRLVEYFDEDPCQRKYEEERDMRTEGAVNDDFGGGSRKKKDLGVKVEAKYLVGEYDILILSAKYSSGLETWLHTNGYKIPEGASKALKPYIQQNLKFFVAKVNLKEQTKTGLQFLRPLQFAYESEKFMLPIRLGMVNAKGPQELLLYVLSRNGRVETSNYRTVKLPSNLEIPAYIKTEFGKFYKDMFSKQVEKENYRVVFTEYFWDMNWCDPCAADPLSKEELKSLGVFWLDGNEQYGGAQNVLVTRLHVRYTPETFPEDLMFQETSDRSNFQGRYILQHPWTGSASACSEAERYFSNLQGRQEKRAQNLSHLTGWDIQDIRNRMNLNSSSYPRKKWWDRIWE
ncbi:MAG: DUF2330 domain-containing protein [Leptospiraceae bacterium]|nr:DUF2330 domain-containing protein [Leptospiraceae bacterium]MCP5500180.1 DUF2330 domain-containing protein [Leptospiraceae bacterium]